MNKREKDIYDSIVDMIEEAKNAATGETVKNAIYEVFPMMGIECVYNGSMQTLCIWIRYFCYGDLQELKLRYTDKTTLDILTGGFVDRVIAEIDDKIKEKIKEKIAEKGNKDENT